MNERVGAIINGVRQDVRVAIRRLMRAPLFTTVGVASLALGIGANTAIFSVIRGVVLAPLPYAESDRVVMLWNAWRGADRAPLSIADLTDYARAQSVASLDAYQSIARNLDTEGVAERIDGAQASPGILATLGIAPARGRGFTPEDAVPGAPRVVMLSHSLWQRRFNGRDVIGRSIELDGVLHEVVGILPESFRLPTEFGGQKRSELLIPLTIEENAPRSEHFLVGVARLKPGKTAALATTDLSRVVSQLVSDGLLPREANYAPYTIPVKQDILGDVRGALFILFAAAGFVLLIACANVAHLLLSVGESRRREMALRSSLGAGYGRLVVQLLIESSVLSGMGAIAALFVAEAGLSIIRVIDPARVPRLADVSIDASVLAFTLAVAVLTGILAGIAPAIRMARADLGVMLRDGGRGTLGSHSGQLLRRVLTSGALAFAVVLVIAASIMLRSFAAISRVPLGFDTSQLLTFRISPTGPRYGDELATTAYFNQVTTQLRALNDVTDAGGASGLPLASQLGDMSVRIEGRNSSIHEMLQANWQAVTPGYLEAMRVKLVSGRLLSAVDRRDALPVAVINRTMAERYWPGQDPIGKRFRLLRVRGEPLTVVGIIEDTRHGSPTEKPHADMFLTIDQFGPATGLRVSAMTFVMRTPADPKSLITSVRSTLRTIDASIPMAQIRTMSEVETRAKSDPAFIAVVLALFAIVALALAAVGIYGVVAYNVSSRTQEIGVRVTLGASTPGIVWLILSSSMTTALSGIVIGAAAAAAFTRVLHDLVYGVATLDVPTFVAVPLLLTAVALAASSIPALRAARLDSIKALAVD